MYFEPPSHCTVSVCSYSILNSVFYQLTDRGGEGEFMDEIDINLREIPSVGTFYRCYEHQKTPQPQHICGKNLSHSCVFIEIKSKYILQKPYTTHFMCSSQFDRAKGFHLPSSNTYTSKGLHSTSSLDRHGASCTSQEQYMENSPKTCPVRSPWWQWTEAVGLSHYLSVLSCNSEPV